MTSPDVTPTGPAVPPDDFVFVQMPDGSVRAVSRAELTVLKGEDKPEPENLDPDVYVHLADGSVVRIPTSEVPSAAGSNAPNGYFIRDGKAFIVTGVYPVESTHKE